MLFFVRENCLIENVIECGYARYSLKFSSIVYVFTHNGLPHVGQRRCLELPDSFAFFNCAEYAFATALPVFLVLFFLFFHSLVEVVVSVVVTVCFALIRCLDSEHCHYIGFH